MSWHHRPDDDVLPSSLQHTLDILRQPQKRFKSPVRLCNSWISCSRVDFKSYAEPIPRPLLSHLRVHYDAASISREGRVKIENARQYIQTVKASGARSLFEDRVSGLTSARAVEVPTSRRPGLSLYLDTCQERGTEDLIALWIPGSWQSTVQQNTRTNVDIEQDQQGSGLRFRYSRPTMDSLPLLFKCVVHLDISADPSSRDDRLLKLVLRSIGQGPKNV